LRNPDIVLPSTTEDTMTTQQIKTHWGVSYQAYGETRSRSLCNRSSGRVVNVETIETGANLTKDEAEVTCSFCKQMITKRPSLTA
jgi:hypothetical protein